MASDIKIGIIGGSGLYQMDGLTDIEEVELETPFGKPSDAYRIGALEGRTVAFLARHHRSHTILPSELNFRANIYGFKKLGVEWIISASAVGSLKEELRPLDIVLPDQFYDRTKTRISTFFGEGIVAHLTKNSTNAQRIIRAAVKRLPVERSCKCGRSLQHAIMTDLKKAPEAT